MALRVFRCVRFLNNRNYQVLPFNSHILSRQLSDDRKDNSLYETLGVSSSASSREIKKAYYDLTLKYHPDRNINDEDAALKFREVAEAYEILGSYASRKRYDRGIPVSKVKKQVTPTVEHKAEFQEFFDSRTSKRSESESRFQHIDDLGSFQSMKEQDENARNMKKETRESKFVSQILILFIFGGALCYKTMY